MLPVKLLRCSGLLLAAALLSVSSCENAPEKHCWDCGPCYPRDRCAPLTESNGTAGAGGLQLNLGQAGESAGGESASGGEAGSRP